MDYKKIKVDVHVPDEVVSVDPGTALSSDPNHNSGDDIDNAEPVATNSHVANEESKEEPKEADPLLEKPTGKLFYTCSKHGMDIILLRLRGSLSEFQDILQKGPGWAR